MDLAKVNWKHYEESLWKCASEQCVDALKYVKGKVVAWNMDKFTVKDRLLKESKEEIKSLYSDNVRDVSSNGELFKAK